MFKVTTSICDFCYAVTGSNFLCTVNSGNFSLRTLIKIMSSFNILLTCLLYQHAEVTLTDVCKAKVHILLAILLIFGHYL